LKKLIGIGLICLFFGLKSELHAQVDSLSQVVAADSLIASDSTLTDSISQDTLVSPQQKILDSLKANSDIIGTVNYRAKDSIIFEIDSSKLYLYGDSDLDYVNMALKAERININWDTQTLAAQGVEDSTGKMIGEPIFSQAQEEYSAKKMIYNFKTEKGRIIGGRTAQGQDYLLSEVQSVFPMAVILLWVPSLLLVMNQNLTFIYEPIK